jgi:hypothetical protein
MCSPMFISSPEDSVFNPGMDVNVCIQVPKFMGDLRAILNFTPRGEICSLGGMFTPSFTLRVEHSTVSKNGGANR